eukprot:XP_013973890.2 potassium channel subfamily K member 16 isoform X1 [Canis lupus familiaris]
MPQARLCSCRGGRVLPLLLAYVCYLLLGATVFQLLEKQAEAQSRDQFQFEKLRFLENYTCLDQRALEQFVQGIIQAYQSGDIVLGNTTSMGRWEFVGSFFFSVSTVTTIGYGNLSPRTMAARLFCIFFALVGIPLNLVVLNRLGHLMQQGMHRCARRLGGTWQDPAKARWLVGSSTLLSGLLFFLLLPPLLFCHMEGWSYVESFYFAFITLSTVGFGDYVIGMDPSRRYPLWYKNTVSLWILFGMAWLALIIKLILSLLETPGRSYSYHHSSKENFKAQSWRQSPDGEAEPRSPQPGCSPEEPMGIIQHPEPSTQVSCCGEGN